MILRLKNEYGLKFLHAEDTFYKMFKTSRQDFLQKLDKNPEKAEKRIIKKIYGAEKPKDLKGRQGVMPLSDSLAIVNKKIQERSRMDRFAKKFVGDKMSAREFR